MHVCRRYTVNSQQGATFCRRGKRSQITAVLHSWYVFRLQMWCAFHLPCEQR